MDGKPDSFGPLATQPSHRSSNCRKADIPEVCIGRRSGRYETSDCHPSLFVLTRTPTMNEDHFVGVSSKPPAPGETL